MGRTYEWSGDNETLALCNRLCVPDALFSVGDRDGGFQWLTGAM